MIVYLRSPRLSLWESWHAEGVTERGTMTLSDPAFRLSLSQRERQGRCRATATILRETIIYRSNCDTTESLRIQKRKQEDSK